MKRIPPEELPYTVASVDIVAELPELVVSVLTLAVGQDIPWHYHSEVTDTFFCLSGCVSIRHDADKEIRLGPGESCEIPPGMPHRVAGSNNEGCRFLIVQGIGKYDFVPVQAPWDGRHS